jgi:cell wall-associated NlpC family hydrolase
VQLERATSRRRPRAVLALGAVLVATAAGLLAPAPASATPRTAEQASKAVEATAQQLTVIDEQVHQAEITVAGQQKAAAAAARTAAAAHARLATYEPQLRAIAQTGYTGKTQSRLAAFLTSDSAAELVQQMTTLDMIATHTENVIAEVAKAQDAARQARAAADALAAKARAGLSQLRAQQAVVQKKVAGYKADFARLSATERATVAAVIAGPTLGVPGDLPTAPAAAAGVAVRVALSKVGAPYAAAAGPRAFDCSGLTMYAYAAAGVALPHSSRAQSTMGRPVSRANLKPGDLVFFYTPISHVGMYIGNGLMVHARTYGVPLGVTSVDQSGYRFARRIVSG